MLSWGNESWASLPEATSNWSNQASRTSSKYLRIILLWLRSLLAQSQGPFFEAQESAISVESTSPDTSICPLRWVSWSACSKWHNLGLLWRFLFLLLRSYFSAISRQVNASRNLRRVDRGILWLEIPRLFQECRQNVVRCPLSSARKSCISCWDRARALGRFSWDYERARGGWYPNRWLFWTAPEVRLPPSFARKWSTSSRASFAPLEPGPVGWFCRRSVQGGRWEYPWKLENLWRKIRWECSSRFWEAPSSGFRSSIRSRTFC